MPRLVLLAALLLMLGCGKSEPTAPDPAPAGGKVEKVPPEVEFDPATAAKMKARKPAAP